MLKWSEACDRVEIATVLDSFVIGLDRMFGEFPIRLDVEAMEDVLALFAPDGVMVTPFGRTEGRDAMREGWRRVATMDSAESETEYVRHHLTSREIVMVDATTAHATSYVQGLTQRGVDHWGQYEDRLVRLVDGWKFAERLVAVHGCVPGGYYAGLPNPVNPTRTW